jgi:microcompartment protein CcmL/EutN
MPHGQALDQADDGDYRALGILETRGLTPLIQGGDAMVKTAPVEIAGWTYIGGALVHLAVRGDVASVEAAVAAGRAAAESAGEVCASLVIPFPAEGVGPLVPRGGAPVELAPPALGILETTGYVAAVGGSDAMVKAAPVEILRLTIASGGRVVALVTGNVDSVTTAVGAGTGAAREAGEWNAARVIPGPSPEVMACFGEGGGERDRTSAAPRKAMGLIETRSTIALVRAVDLMLKTADVEYEGRHKVGYFLTASVVRGDVASVRTAVETGAAEAEKWGDLVSAHVIPRPFEEMESRLVHH